jgi:hypothetical protein
VLSVIELWFSEAQSQEGNFKKLIYYGWGIRDTQYIRNHWQQMEEMPFDGTGVIVGIDRSKSTVGDGATNNQLGWQVMGRRPFRVEEFREAIAHLKTPKWQKLKDNFLPVSLSSSVSAAGLNWFDEERWKIISNNFGALSKIAAEGGLKGLILDPEHYSHALFSFTVQWQQMDRSFDEYVEIARRRGREVMRSISDSLSAPVLFSLYAYTLPLSELRRGLSLKEATYSLLPAFYDGLLEAMPEGAYLVDGYEFAYGFKERKQFLKGYHQIHGEAIKLSQVPDRYRDKVKAGFGLWLDYRNQQNYFTPEEFRKAISHALEVSNGYVWIYSHGPSFFPPSYVETSYVEAMASARKAK